MAHPAIIDTAITSGSALQAYLKRNQGHLFAGHVGTDAAAAQIHAILKATSGNWAGGRQATRIVRPLRHAADLQLEASKMFTLCLSLFHGAYPPVNQAGQRRKFEPHK